MKNSPNSVIRIPRGFIEHPTLLSAQQRSIIAQYRSEDGALTHQLQIGQVDRWRRTPPVEGPGFNLENLSVLFALISFHQSYQGSFSTANKTPPLSYNQIFKIITPGSKSCSAHHRETLKSTLADLSSIDVALLDSQKPIFEPLISVSPAHSAPVFGRVTPAFEIQFSPLFLDLLCDTQACNTFNIETFFGLRSRYARALALFLPTWIYYHRSFSQKFPFKITLAKLIEHLGLPVPRHKSQRRALFGGHRKTGIFEAINNLQTTFGTIRLKVESATSVDDDCLSLWLDHAPNAPSPRKASSPRRSVTIENFRSLKIYDAWNSSGRTNDEFINRVQRPSRLSAHDQEILKIANISLSRSERFLTMAKKLLPENTWLDILGEAKYCTQSTTPPKNPTAKLISEVLNAVRTGI